AVWRVAAYILAFSGGVLGAMALYATAIGGLFGTVAGGAGARWYPWLAGAAGSITVLLGLGWIAMALAAPLAALLSRGRSRSERAGSPGRRGRPRLPVQGP